MRSFQKPTITPDKLTVLYPKKDGEWEPPPPINGYRRDAKNHWLFHMEWLPCPHRFESFFRKICGAVGMLAICRCPEAPPYQKKVKVVDCKNCPFNK